MSVATRAAVMIIGGLLSTAAFAQPNVSATVAVAAGAGLIPGITAPVPTPVVVTAVNVKVTLPQGGVIEPVNQASIVTQAQTKSCTVLRCAGTTVTLTCGSETIPVTPTSIGQDNLFAGSIVTLCETITPTPPTAGKALR